MEDWFERFKEFMAQYLQGTQPELNVDKVTSIYQDDGDPFSGCETCGWGTTEPFVDIDYVDVDGNRGSVTLGNLPSIFGY